MENDNVIKSSYDRNFVNKTIKENQEEAKQQKTATKKTTTKKTTTSSTKTKPKEDPKPTQVAVYSSGKVAHPALGRLDKGYNIVTPAQADEWMKLSNKVRMATPEEVAAAYEV
jgi:cell division protein FtsN